MPEAGTQPPSSFRSLPYVLYPMDPYVLSVLSDESLGSIPTTSYAGPPRGVLVWDLFMFLPKLT